MRLLLLSLALAFVSSSCDGVDHDCACTISIGADTLNLACGESGCVAGYGFGCDNDVVQELGRCTRDDGGACVAAGAVCDPSVSACCSPTDGGAVTLSCDPTTRRCCAAGGTACTTSADCCPGHVCENSADGLRCSN